LVAYTRVAVGVHYPFDILVGALSGMIFGIFWIVMFTKVIKIKGQTPV
jgi:membrane-associated phospholipid phosphatase